MNAKEFTNLVLLIPWGERVISIAVTIAYPPITAVNDNFEALALCRPSCLLDCFALGIVERTGAACPLPLRGPPAVAMGDHMHITLPAHVGILSWVGRFDWLALYTNECQNTTSIKNKRRTYYMRYGERPARGFSRGASTGSGA